MDGILVDNKYSRWYFAIIDKARSENRKRGPGRYYERHHVLPQCLYPALSKAKDNTVLLTAREHFVCHWLLTKMVNKENHRQRLLGALGAMMRRATAKHEREIIRSGWRYEICRKAFSVRSSLIMSAVHKGKTISPEHKAALSKHFKGRKLHTEEFKDRMRGLKKGVLRSEETKAKVRFGVIEYVKRHGPANTGSRWSEESRERLKTKFKQFGHPSTGRKNPAPLVTCPHCNKIMSARPAGRWHFDNCKQKGI